MLFQKKKKEKKKKGKKKGGEKVKITLFFKINVKIKNSGFSGLLPDQEKALRPRSSEGARAKK